MASNQSGDDMAMGDLNSNFSGNVSYEDLEFEMGPMIMLPLSILGTVLGLSITYIVVCLKTPKLRQDQGKWLQVSAVIANAVYTTCFLLDVLLTYSVSAPVYKTVPALCILGVPLTWVADHLFTVCLLLVTLERLISLWRGDEKVPGFTLRTTTIVLALTTGILTIIVAGFIFGFGGVKVGQSQGFTYCYTTMNAFLALSIMYLPSFLGLLILTALMIGRLCKSRACDAMPYPLHKALPIILGNLLMLLAFLALAAMENYLLFALDTEPLAHIVLLLCWLLGERDVRVAYWSMCCPCCPQVAPDEDTVELVNA